MDGLNATLSAWYGKEYAARLSVPANPRALVMVICAVAEDPTAKVIRPGLAVTVTPGVAQTSLC